MKSRLLLLRYAANYCVGGGEGVKKGCSVYVQQLYRTLTFRTASQDERKGEKAEFRLPSLNRSLAVCVETGVEVIFDTCPVFARPTGCGQG